jgi:hypothetical protein
MIKKIFLLFIFCLLFTTSKFAQEISSVDKKTIVTLIDSNKIRVECFFKHKANIQFKYFSDMVFVESNLSNIIVKFNNRILSPSLYLAGVEKTKRSSGLRKRYVGYIVLKNVLTSDGDLNIYMSFEAKIALRELMQYELELYEVPIKSEPQTKVSYELIIKSALKNYAVNIFDRQGKYLINKSDTMASLKRQYLSDIIDTLSSSDLVPEITFTNTDFSPISEESRVIKLLSTDLVSEHIEYNMIGVMDKEIFSLNLSLPHIRKIVEKPRVTVNIDGKELQAYNVSLEKLDELDWNKSPEIKFLYYLGEDPQVKSNFIIIRYILNKNEIANLSIELTYDAKEKVLSEDGFNYQWEYGLLFYVWSKKPISRFINFIIPDGFYIEDESIKSHIIKSSSNMIAYKFVESGKFSNNPFILYFSRHETVIYNVLKIFNITILLISITILILILTKIIKYKSIHFKIYSGIISFFYAFILGKLSNSNFFEAVIYTWSWIPLILVITSLIYPFFAERQSQSKTSD